MTVLFIRSASTKRALRACWCNIRAVQMLHQFAKSWASYGCAGWVQLRRAVLMTRLMDLGLSSVLRTCQKPIKRHRHNLCQRFIRHGAAIPVQNFPSKPVAAVFGPSLAIAALLTILTGCAGEMPDGTSLQTALEKAETAFTQTPVRGDVGFLIQQGASLTGRQIRLEQDVSPLPGILSGNIQYELALWQQGNKTLPEIPHTPLPGKGADFDPNYLRHDPEDTRNPQRAQMVLSVMREALTCSPRAQMDLLRLKPDYGYVSNHQLLGLLIASRRDCISEAQLANHAHPIIVRIHQEMLHYGNELSDLQVERAAFLAMIGRLDAVPPRLVKKLLDTQYDDGLWLFDNNSAASLNVALHHSALAYLLISAAYAESQKNNE